MTRFEKALVYALFVLAGVSMLLTGRRIEALEQQVKALEMRERPAAVAEADMAPLLAMSEIPAAARREDRPEVRTATFTAFAYCACSKCCGRWSQYGLTASGTAPQQGRTVAVDPDVIPLGTQLTIDGSAGYIAEDTGSGIEGNTLDIYFERHEDALRWGVRKVTVTWEG